MEFEKNVPEWNATGTEPPSTLKESGFTEGYKPPAAYFNWFWNRVSACLTEIRMQLSGHANSKDNPHNVTKAQIGLGNVDNTKDSAKSVSYANSAGMAEEVSSNLAIQLNGGTVEGTSKFTYNGSAAKTVNITPEKISAAKSDLSNVPADAFRSKVTNAAVGVPTIAAASSDGIAYTATAAGISELYNGLMVVIIPNVNSASTQATFNLNGLGAKTIRQPLSFNTAAMTQPKLANFLVAGRPVLLQFDANYVAGGIWKTMDKQKTSAQDLYGTVPIENGGTGAETAAAARENLGITPANIGAAAASHGTHVTYGSTAAALGSAAAAGSASSVSRSDHVHPYPAIINCTGILSIQKGGTGAVTAVGAVENMRDALVNLIYPVGSIYISATYTNPARLFGGTWEQIKDRFLLAGSSIYELGTTGGEATHVLTIDEMPMHQHNNDAAVLASGSVEAVNKFRYSSDSTSYLGNLATKSTGGNQAHNNMPPYLVVNIWKRTA